METLTKKDLLEAIKEMPMNSLIEIKMLMPNIKFHNVETITNSAKEVKCGKYVITISAC